MRSTEFQKQNLRQKHRVLIEDGRKLTARHHGSFEITLYSLSNYYVEIWRKIGLNHIYWIEIVSNEQVVRNYCNLIDLSEIM